MTTSISTTAGSTTIQPIIAGADNLGRVVTDAPAATTTDTFASTTTAPATHAPALPTATTTGTQAAPTSVTSNNKKRVKFSDIDKTLPFYKRVLIYVDTNFKSKQSTKV